MYTRVSKFKKADAPLATDLKAMQAEVAKLKAELRRTAEERDILKKAAAYFRKLPQIENNMKIEASISLRRRDEEVKVYGEPDCWNLG